MNIKYNFVKDLCTRKEINVCYIPTENQIADILTKALTKVKFVDLRMGLGLPEARRI